MGTRIHGHMHIILGHLSQFARPVPFLVGAGKVEVHSEPKQSATLVCRLPRGIYTAGFVRENAGREEEASKEEAKPGRKKTGAFQGRRTWVQLITPVPGWADLFSLQPLQLNAVDAVQSFMRNREFATAQLLGIMHHVRKMFTGDNPLGACGVSAELLCKQIVSCELESALGRGKARVINGSFLAKAGSHTWWPHSFVVFGDGTIADVTADQFDNVPQIWFPAERARYSFMVAEDKTRVEGGQPAQADESDGTLTLFGKWQLPPPGATLLLPGGPAFFSNG